VIEATHGAFLLGLLVAVERLETSRSDQCHRESGDDIPEDFGYP
jgi:hypothetical protein